MALTSVHALMALVTVALSFHSISAHTDAQGLNSHSHCEFDVLILLDTSGSIKEKDKETKENRGDENWKDVKKFATTLVNDIDQLSDVGTDTRIGIISYSGSVITELPLNDAANKAEVDSKIDAIKYQGQTTHMYEAVQRARDHMYENERQTSAGTKATQIVILFTDGVPFSFTSTDETSENVMIVLEDLMNNQVHIMMVGVNNYDPEMMTQIVEYVNEEGSDEFGRSMEATTFEELGSERFSIMVLQPFDMSCRDVPSGCKMDIMVLIDASGSIGREKFEQELKPFVKTFVDQINMASTIMPQGTRVGAATFSRGSQPLIGISEGTSLEAVQNSLDTMLHRNSWTHMVEHINAASEHLLSNRRSGVPMRLVVITDGLPEHYLRDQSIENVENLIATVTAITQGSRPIDFTFVGFKGKKVELQLGALLDQLSAVASTWNAEEMLSEVLAMSIVEQFGLDCPAEDLLDMRATDLVIVLDDTSAEAREESGLIARDVIRAQLQSYISAPSGQIQVTVVSSRGIVPEDQLVVNRDINSIIVSDGKYGEVDGSGDADDDNFLSIRQDELFENVEDYRDSNKLLLALEQAYMQLLGDRLNGRYKLVLVIHSGVVNFDADFNEDPMNSIYEAAYFKLKRTVGAEIASLPLSTMTEHGREVLERLQTLPGPLLDLDVNVPFLISSASPRFVTCEEIDVVFLMDISHSTDIPMLRFQARSMLLYLRDNYQAVTRVSLVAFSEFPYVYNDLENGQLSDDATFERLITTIENLKSSTFSMTNLAYALDVVSTRVFMNHGDRLQGTDHVIIFSDTGANMQTTGTVLSNNKTMDLTHQMVQSIMLVQPPIMVDMTYDDTTFNSLVGTRNIEEAGDIFSAEVERYRDCRPLDITPSCRHMIIVSDSSGSLQDQGRSGYEKVQNYVSNLIQSYYSTQGAQELAVVQFSYKVKTLVELGYYRDTYNQPGGPIEIVQTAKFIDGLTNVEIALDRAMEITADLNKESYVVVFISDGESNRGRDGAEVLREIYNDGTNLLGVFLTDTFANDQEGMRDVIPEDQELYLELFDQLSEEENVAWVINKICG